MRLTNRLIRLERVRQLHNCVICNDRGTYVISRINEGDPVPRPSGCAACGKIHHIIVRYVPKPIPQWNQHVAAPPAIETT